MPCKKKLAFYIRLSLEDFDLKSSGKMESNSVTNQRKLLQDYYHAHPELTEYEVAEFCDDGFTGTNFERPRFQAMMELVRQREIQAIIVKDLSRFGRDYLEVGAYLELILPLFGTRFISVNDSFDSKDYAGTTGGVELALRNLINGLYSRDLSVKIKSANMTRRRRGDYQGGTAFYGYLLDPKDKHHLIVDTNVSDTIVRIYNACIAGSSASQIARQLNDEAIPSPAKYKHTAGEVYNGRIVDSSSIWTATTVLRILKDERYTGKMISNKRESVGIHTGKMRPLPKEEWIVVDGTHEAIISQELFDLALEARTGRIKTINKNTSGNRSDNLFVCGYCGRKLQKAYGATPHLFCLKAQVVSDSPCAALHEPIDALQVQVLQVVQVLAGILLERSAKMQVSLDLEEPRLKREVAGIKKLLQKIQNGKLDLYEAYRQGKMNRNQFMAAQEKRQWEADRLGEELKSLENRLALLTQKTQQLEQTTKDAKDIQVLSEYRPDVIRRLIRKIRVFGNGRMEVDMVSNDDFVLDAAESIKQSAL